MDERTPPAGADLASRIKATIEARIHESKMAEEAERERRERMARAVTDLMANLESFGRAVGYFEVSRRKNRLSFQFDGRLLAFEADGSTVRVSGTHLTGASGETKPPARGDDKPPPEPVLEYQDLLEKWILTRMEGPRRVQVPLFDQGLSDLIRISLGVH